MDMPDSSNASGHASVLLRFAQEIDQGREVRNLRSIIRGLIRNSMQRGAMDEQDVRQFLLRLNEAETAEDIERVGEELVEAGYVPAFFPRNQLDQFSKADVTFRRERPPDQASQSSGQEHVPSDSEETDDQADWETQARGLEEEVNKLGQENQSLQQANDRLTDRVDQLQEQVAELQASRGEDTPSSGETGDDTREPLTVEELGEIVDELDLDVDWEDYEFPVIIRGRDEEAETDPTD